MKRGSTPTITMRLPSDVSCSDVIDAIFSIAQLDKEIISKKFVDFKTDMANNVFMVTLAQEETFKLNPCYRADLQLKVKTKDGNVIPSDIFSVPVGKILNEDVM